jgi:hypothetical protein
VDFTNWTQSPTDPAFTNLLEHIHPLVFDRPLPPAAAEPAGWQRWLQRRRWLLAGIVVALVLAGLAAYMYRPASCDPQSGFCVYVNCFLHDPSNQIRSGVRFEDCRASCIAAGDRCRAFSHAPDERGGICMLAESYDDIRKRPGSRIGVDASRPQPTAQQLAVCGGKP